MGVRRFMTFVSERRLYEDDVDLASYGREHAARHGLGERMPVLVVDLLNIVRCLWSGLDWVCGGRHRLFELRLKNFVTRFREKGIKLVFVMDGSSPEGKFGTWLERKRKLVNMSDDLFNYLDDDEADWPNSLRDSFLLPNLMVELVLKQLGGCEVVCAYGDADKRTSEIAQERQAFGILAYDSDYLFFPAGDIVLFSSRPDHFTIFDGTGSNFQPLGPWDIVTIKSRMISPDAVAQYLQLTRDQMPMLASLVGNDIVPHEDLLEFHERICETANGGANLVRLLSDKIRTAADGDSSVEQMMVQNEAFALKVKTSVDSYTVRCEQVSSPSQLDQNANVVRTNNDWDSIVRTFAKAYERCEAPQVFLVMQDHPVQMSVYAEERRREKSALPMTSEVYSQLRRKIYGILLLEKPGALNEEGTDFVLHVKEWVCLRQECIERLRRDGPDRVKPLMPPLQLHPGLLSLHSTDSSDPDLELARWKLFAHCVGGAELHPAILMNLDKGDVRLFCTLFIMTRHRAPEEDKSWLEEWEVQAFILQHFRLNTWKDDENLKRLSLCGKANARAVHLATIYDHSRVADLSWAVGNAVPAEHFLPAKNFDGFIFQRIYEDFLSYEDRNQYWRKRLSMLPEDASDEAQAIFFYLRL